MLSTSICTKIPTLYPYQNSCSVGPGGFLEQNLTNFFFLAKVLEFVSWISKYVIYMSSCKNTNVVFRQNSWLAGAKGIFVQN